MNRKNEIKITVYCLILLLLFLFPIKTAFADIGPKPSVNIEFLGIKEKYYVTLLSKTDFTGPFSATYYKGDENDEIDNIFSAYVDSDGFYYLHTYQDCSETNKYVWGYYPPSVFKILIYFPESNSFSVSGDILQRYAFDSYFKAEADGKKITSVTKSYDYTLEIFSLLARIAATIIIELLIAFLFGFREKKQIIFIMLINIFTQGALNIALNVINYNQGQLMLTASFFLFEFAVFVAEAVIYTLFLKKLSKDDVPVWKPPVYALAANLCSLFAGFALLHIIPGIF